MHLKNWRLQKILNPAVFQIAEIIGKEETVKRVEYALKQL